MADDELQKLRAQLAEHEAFTRRLAHDMGAPLRTIQGFTEVLQVTARPQLSGKSLEYLERLGQAASRLDAMVKSLGQYARIGPTEPPEEPSDLTGLVREVWAMLEADVERTGAVLEVEEMPCVPVAEPPLRSVLLNLFDNALRHTDGQPRVTVSASGGGGKVRVNVVDQGPGMDEDEVEWALSPGSARSGEGAGMGLAIARAHVEAHGGELGIEPNQPRGTRVWFTLPA